MNPRRVRHRFSFIDAELQAFHTDPHMGEGRHAHTWNIRLFYNSRPFKDGRALAAGLETILGAWRGKDLPDGTWSTEDLAEAILRLAGNGDPVGVCVTRPDGPGAEVWF